MRRINTGQVKEERKTAKKKNNVIKTRREKKKERKEKRGSNEEEFHKAVASCIAHNLLLSLGCCDSNCKWTEEIRFPGLRVVRRHLNVAR